MIISNSDAHSCLSSTLGVHQNFSWWYYYYQSISAPNQLYMKSVRISVAACIEVVRLLLTPCHNLYNCSAISETCTSYEA